MIKKRTYRTESTSKINKTNISCRDLLINEERVDCIFNNKRLLINSYSDSNNFRKFLKTMYL